MNALTAVAPQTAALQALVADTLDYAAASRAASTVRQYESNWAKFASFCTKHGFSALPTTVQVVSVYLASLAKEGLAVSTVTSHLAAIKYFHDRNRLSANWDDPIISEVMAGIRRSAGRKVEGAQALLPEDLRKLVEGASPRDAAILLVGFAGAFRRSEIVALTMENVEMAAEGLVLTLVRSKTDQEGRGAEVAIPYASDPALCAVRALQAWITSSGITTGPLFRKLSKAGKLGPEALSEDAVRLILAKAVERSGLEATGRISPHSLRAGFCTTAAMAGRSLMQIARQARHASIQTTSGYVRVAERFKDHAGAGLI